MILYFLRHGKAGQGNPSDPTDDARKLTDTGAAELRAAAPLWRRLNLRPDVILSSPLPRAFQTAELFAAGIHSSHEPLVDDRLRPGAEWADLAQALATHRDARRVIFVGHEPDFSMAIQELTGARAVRMRKGGLACVEFPGIPEAGAGELVWLLDPDLYEED
ncbi:MAG TPA: histidine phosphatase family protein [Candidatus Limnocylindria bacterium]|nr:histidine phosphatase family protein [Candidatus Limnocylindria bacterium]